MRVVSTQRLRDGLINHVSSRIEMRVLDIPNTQVIRCPPYFDYVKMERVRVELGEDQQKIKSEIPKNK